MVIPELIGELAELFDRYPTLAAAYQTVRSDQDPEYMARTDQFERTCLKPLGHTLPVEKLFGTNLVVGIDVLFERQGNSTTLNALVAGLELPTRTNAQQILTDSPAAPSLREAIDIHLAALTMLGYDRLISIDKPAEVAEVWLAYFREEVTTYINQQEDHTCMTFSSDYCPDQRSFEDAARNYTRRFASTSGLSISTAGTVSYSPHADIPFISGLSTLMPSLNQLFRLALDVAYDASEPLNAAVFAYASEQQISLAHALETLQSSPALQNEVSGRLAKLYEQTYTTCAQTVQIVLECDKYQCAVLRPFAETALKISQALSQRWKPQLANSN